MIPSKARLTRTDGSGAVTAPWYRVRLVRIDWCDYECLVYRDSFLVAEGRATSGVGAVQSARRIVTMRRSLTKGRGGLAVYGARRDEI